MTQEESAQITADASEDSQRIIDEIERDRTGSDDLYKRLAAPFDYLMKDTRGGVTFNYATGEQVISRCNIAFGVGGWYSKVLEWHINEDADEIFVLGEMGALINGSWVVHQQFGSQKLKRSRATGKILDIGFDLKGATTDAHKKCASQFGIALYLYVKEPARGEDARQAPPPPRRVQDDRSRLQPYSEGTHDAPTCRQCGKALTPVSFDKTEKTESGQQVRKITWTIQKLAENGRRKHGAVLCSDHYREANRLKFAQSAS